MFCSGDTRLPKSAAVAGPHLRKVFSPQTDNNDSVSDSKTRYTAAVRNKAAADVRLNHLADFGSKTGNLNGGTRSVP